MQQALERVRERLTAAIEAVCGGSPRAQDVINAFGVHRKLGWQLWNVAFTEEPLAAVRFLPNARSMDVWREAASQRGVPEELLERLDESFAEFQRLAGLHAQDREMLEMMVEAVDPRPSEAADLRWRKQAYSGNSYIWGVRARTMLATVLLHPSQKEGYFDMVRLSGLIDLVRTRPDVRWPFAQSVVESGDGTRHAPLRRPLVESPGVRESGVPLVEAFCSQPLPPVTRREGTQGMLEDELQPGPIGQTGASTIVTGEILREVAPVRPAKAGGHAYFGSGVRTPSEVLVSDHFVHRDLWPGVERELRVFSELISPTTRDERDRLRVHERLQPLGRGLERVRTAEVPRYADLLGQAFEETGWDPDEFHVFRVRMRYPPIPVAVMVRHPMPLPES